MQYIYPSGQNNGRISESIDGVSGEDVQYSYDALQRLILAQTTGNGPQWGDAYAYDGFGNLQSKTPTLGSAPGLAVTYDPATNRPSGPGAPSYDANGNAQVGTWDLENHLISETLDGAAVDWGYDPSGKRVLRHQQMTGYDDWTLNFYGPSGQLLGKVDCITATDQNHTTGCTGQGANVYFGGRLVARTLPQPGTWVQTPWGWATALSVTGVVMDRLGSVRAFQTQTNGTWTQTSYYPFGEEKTPVTADGIVKFATYTRDSTLSAQDYADQRYYSNLLGRFYSPDPARLNGVSLAIPATWNLYAYVGGDPVNFSDPTGLCPPGYVPATSDQLQGIVDIAKSYVGNVDYDKTGHFKVEDGVLTQIDCSGLVSQALAGIAYSDTSFTKASAVFTTSQTSSLFSQDSSFQVGDIIWLPGHVGIVASVDSSGKVTSFIGSQTSTGPAVVDLTDSSKTYWQSQMSSAKAYVPCVPASQQSSGSTPTTAPVSGTGTNPNAFSSQSYWWWAYFPDEVGGGFEVVSSSIHYYSM